MILVQGMTTALRTWTVVTGTCDRCDTGLEAMNMMELVGAGAGAAFVEYIEGISTLDAFRARGDSNTKDSLYLVRGIAHIFFHPTVSDSRGANESREIEEDNSCREEESWSRAEEFDRGKVGKASSETAKLVSRQCLVGSRTMYPRMPASVLLAKLCSIKALCSCSRA